MDLQLMAALSNADAIASNEGEVRTILRDYLKPVDLKVQTDGLGFKPLASHWQSVRVTTVSGKKIAGHGHSG